MDDIKEARIEQLFDKARRCGQNGDVDLAISLFEEVLHLEATHFLSLWHLAQSYRYVRKYAIADEYYGRALAQQPNHLELLAQVNQFRLDYHLHISTHRRHLVSFSSLPLLTHAGDVFEAHRVSLSSSQFTWNLVKRFLPEDWAVDWLVFAPLELSKIPLGLDDCPHSLLGIVTQVHPYAERLAHVLPLMDAVLVKSRADQEFCKQYTQAPVYYLPFYPMVPLVKDEEPVNWDERTYDMACVLDQDNHSPVYRAFLKQVESLQSLYRIKVMPRSDEQWPQVMKETRVFVQCPGSDDGFDPLLHLAMQRDTVTMTPQQLHRETTCAYAWTCPYRLDNFTVQFKRMVSHPSESSTFLSAAQKLLQQQWSVARIFKHTFDVLDQKKKRPVKKISQQQGWFQRLSAMMYDWPRMKTDVKEMHGQLLDWCESHPYDLVAYHHLGIVSALLACKKGRLQDVYKTHYKQAFKHLLEQEPYYPQALFHKMIFSPLLKHVSDDQSAQILLDHLSMRAGEHHFFDETLLCVQILDLPWLNQRYSRLYEMDRSMSNEDFIVAYKNILMCVCHRQLAKQALERHHKVGAKEHLQQALALCPEDIGTAMHLALLALQSEDLTQARYYAQQVLWQDPLHGTAKLIMASTEDTLDDLPALAGLLQATI